MTQFHLLFDNLLKLRPKLGMMLPLSCYECFAVDKDCFVHLQNDISFICQRKFAFFRLAMGAFDLSPASLRCKYKFDIGAVNMELVLFTFFLVSNKFVILQGTEEMQRMPLSKICSSSSLSRNNRVILYSSNTWYLKWDIST